MGSFAGEPVEEIDDIDPLFRLSVLGALISHVEQLRSEVFASRRDREDFSTVSTALDHLDIELNEFSESVKRLDEDLDRRGCRHFPPLSRGHYLAVVDTHFRLIRERLVELESHGFRIMELVVGSEVAVLPLHRQARS